MRILIADDDKSSRQVMVDYLEGLLGHEVVQCTNGEEALEKFREQSFQLILSDIRMPMMSGNKLLSEIKAQPEGKKANVVLFTGYAELESAVQALKDGALDYLYKPIDVYELHKIISRISEKEELQRKIKSAAQDADYIQSDKESKYNAENVLENGAFIYLAGKYKFGIFSDKMKEAVSVALKLHEHRDMPVLIEGESGTGKELVANLVHYGTKNENRPLVSINCSAISAGLFESELFGYEGGAYTGSRQKGMKGKMEMAEGGTLFLDEIGELPLDMQPKLLRMIQDRSFYRVGGQKSISVDVRIITATNKNLKELVDQGRFRSDLYYRLNTGSIYLPPLRERKEAIPSLAQMFLLDFAEKRNKQFRIISEKAVEILKEYEWYGNIRELRNILDRIVLLYDEIELRGDHLKILDLDQSSLSSKDNFILKPDTFELPDEKLNLNEIETAIIKKALEKFKGNQTKAAQYLGISRGTLHNKLKKL